MQRPRSTGGYGAVAGPWAVAHRGGAGLAPENTMEAFERSYALGVRFLETDARVTADGVCVAFHDDRLDRVTGARGRLGSRTWREVGLLRVHGTARVPAIADLLDAFPDASFTVDVKDERAIGPLARLLRRHGATERVCVAGAWDGWLSELRERAGPGLATAWGWRSTSALLARAWAGLGPSHCGAGDFLHVPVRLGGVPVFTPRVAEAAHLLGARVLVWTVDDPVVMHRVLDAGADGVITDRPDLLREVLVARGQWTASAAAADVQTLGRVQAHHRPAHVQRDA